MNILIICTGMDAVSYHRLVAPWSRLNEMGEIRLTVFFSNVHGKADDIESFEGLDAVIFNRNISDISVMNPIALINRIKRDGAVVICDTDDYWILNKHHIINDFYRKVNMTKCLIANMRHASGISCSTPPLKTEIFKEIGVVPTVLRNAIDPSHEQFNLSENKHVYGSICFVGGVTHERDLNVAYNGLKGVESPIMICGYEKHEIWDRIVDRGEDMGLNMRVQIKKGILNYGKFYWDKGICLAPLEAVKFNRYKSELKMLEGGHFSKVMVVSDYQPFQGISRHMENCIVVREGNWAKWINLLLKNTQLQDDLRGQLNIDVKKLNDIDTVNESFQSWKITKPQ